MGLFADELKHDFSHFLMQKQSTRLDITSSCSVNPYLHFQGADTAESGAAGAYCPKP